MHTHVRRCVLACVSALAAALAAPAGFAADPGQKPLGRATSPVKSTSEAASPALEQRVAELESQLAALLAAVRVKQNGDLELVGQNVKLEAQKAFTVRAVQSASIDTGGTLLTRAGGNAKHEAGAELVLAGPSARLPDATTRAGKPLATVGSPVTGSCPPNGGPLADGHVLP